jgi:hypothetical protein
MHANSRARTHSPAVVGSAAYGVLVPPILLLAAVLAAQRVSFVLVGSAALWLRGEDVPVADVDAVPEPGAANLVQLHAALTTLAVRDRLVPRPGSLSVLDMVTVPTSYGKLDCLLERGRRDWHRLRRGAGIIRVADAGVLVASAADAWSLRRAFKG